MIVLNTAEGLRGQAPFNWQIKVNHGKPEVSVCPDPAGACLHLKSVSSSFALERGVDIDPTEMPYLTWRWKVAQLPQGGDKLLRIKRVDSTRLHQRHQQALLLRERRGSVAAPTAGLHFTPQILDELAARGVEIARITLHVGLGTFAPLRVERVDEVHLHRERYTLSESAADAINNAARSARRIVAVGTTVVRTLEHCAKQAVGSPLEPHSGETEIFISPGFDFRLVGGLLTNFHLPQSSLLMLVSAFAGREAVLAAYRHAVEQKYRFFSYGDCMFLS